MSTNDGGHVIELFIGTIEDEMAALEALGPLARRAICESPVRISAQPILKQLQEFEKKQLEKITENIRHYYRINFADPQFDGYVARGITEDARKTLLKDCTEQDANTGVVPMVPRISVKSIREQRRSARRVRW